MDGENSRDAAALPCVVTLGVNGPAGAGHPDAIFQDYSRGIARIRRQLDRFQFRGHLLAWDQNYPDGAPTVAEAQFAFKPFCLADAQRRGYRLVLWMDSSMRIKRPLDPLFESIQKRGYLLFPETHAVGEFCKDEALAPLGITREESFRIPSCWSGVMGLDLDSPTAVEFLRQWKERASDGISFPGPKWSGVSGWPRTASQDPRVKGHRHDQTAASVIAYRLGMSDWESQERLYHFFEPDRGFVRRYRGEPHQRAIVDTLRAAGRAVRRILPFKQS